MKYIFLLALVAISRPIKLLAHDGNDHVEVAWYQNTDLLTVIVSIGLVVMIMTVGGYYLPKYRKLLAGISIAGVVFGFVGFQMNQNTPVPVSESVVASLRDVPATVYRTAGCACCGGFAKELSDAGAEVMVKTISPAEMDDLKNKHGIAQDQESCHTSVIEGYVVEGHVPFEAIAKLVSESPAINGITLPGMPIGTPGMPGKQTEVYTVTTLSNELFWQSS